MTDANPYQTQPDSFYTNQAPGAPSILGVTLITAALAAAVFSVPSAISHIALGCCWNCVAGFGVALLGLLAGFLLATKSPLFNGGHGFAAGFLGVGLGATLGVIVQLNLPGYDEAELKEQLKEITDEAWKELQRSEPNSGVDREDLADIVEWILTLSVLPLALVGTVLAGFAGLLVVALMNNRRRRQPAYVQETQHHQHDPREPPAPPEPPTSPWQGPQA